jgi:lipopolysaccharide export system permease protein
MRILDRYIRNSVISSTGIVILVLLGMEFFIEFLGELPYIGVEQYGILSAFFYIGMQLPSELYQLFPVAGFIGALIGLGRLASTSELIIMRAAGVSIARIAWSVVKAALLMLIVITVIGEWQGPVLQYESIQYKQIKTKRNLNPWTSEGLWLHHGQSFIFIDSVVSNTAIKDINRFDFNKNGQLISALNAETAILESGEWKLQKVSLTRFEGENTLVEHHDQLPLDFTFQPELLAKRMQRDPSQQTIVELWRNIQYRMQSGLLATELESAFWSRVLQPLTTVVMICLGVPFIFGSLRSSSMSSRLLTGIIVGFIFYMLNQFLGPLALVYQWPSWIAGVLPVMFFLLVYAVLLYRIRL